LRDEVAADLRDVVLRGTVGYAVGTGGVVLQTVDGGRTWRREGVESGADLNGVAMSADGQIVAAVGDGGTVLVKREGGWRAVATPTSADLVDVTLSADSAHGIVYCSSSRRVFSMPVAGSLTPLAAQPSLPAGVAIRDLALVESPRRTRLVAGATGGWLAGWRWEDPPGGGNAAAPRPR
jgi:photosystem II stability/assembly factor-like uncharacterized protein